LQFNGYFVTLKGVQTWMKWAIYCSPVFYGIQQIAVELFSDGTPQSSPSYPSSGQFVIDNYAYSSDFAGPALGVFFGMIFFFRVSQVLALKKFNNPEK
jgi:hypothetical protein